MPKQQARILRALDNAVHRTGRGKSELVLDTYNTADFRQLAGVEAVTPEQALDRYR